MRRTTLAAALLLAAALAGCVSASRATSWRGHSLDDLQFAWGPPDRTTELADGRRMVAYEHAHYGGGNSYQCTATFGADRNGIIVSATTSGNIGGCNGLLSGKAPAP